ncbi:MAG TPA: glycoside hydrolase family 2 TIM barrel-domain containing protein, partial [Verrucomicrobiae bacterium]
WESLSAKTTVETPEINWQLSETPALKLANQMVSLAPGETRTIQLSAMVNEELSTWTPEHPNLYGMMISISANGQEVDKKYQRFGWRQFTIDGNRFLLNGRPITLHGDSWHFMGVPQMTRRYAFAWYQMLKDAGANAVRLHASVYPEFYHDMADEMGIMILDESAIWASDGGPKADSDQFWQNCREHVAKLVLRDRNHPSVFGWSVCNEILPVLQNVWHTPASMVDHCLAEISVWEGICRTNDPTRAWVSGDGEWDASGRLPVINIHYGGDGELQRAAKSGKPFAIGETSMAYYGTPRQVAKFNGDRAYASDLGRMEGLAYECYGLLTSQQKYGAHYQSVFNLVWYSLQPLPFGKTDPTHSSVLTEGIRFPAFQEGVPGMQPERLGPYVSTLNPGYDPALPLYRPWPMFFAIQDANHGVAQSAWAKPPANQPAAGVTNLPAGLAAMFVPSNNRHLVGQLQQAGLQAVEYHTNSPGKFLLIDGSGNFDTATQIILKEAIAATVSQGGSVWVWNIDTNGAPALSTLLDLDIEVAARTASSLVVDQPDGLVAGLDNARLYFSENDDFLQMRWGLTGQILNGAKVLLSACPAEWRSWNYRGEPVKTAALFRSEVENPAPRVALLSRSWQGGQLVLCNLDPNIGSVHKLEVMRQLLQNAGLNLAEVAAPSDFLDLSGRLRRALVCGSFGFTNVEQAYTEPLPAATIKPGSSLSGQTWRQRSADVSGIFNFKDLLKREPQDSCYAYVAIWIKSPKPLNDLLSEPNLPKLKFNYGSDDGCQLWLNDELLATQKRTGPLDPDAFTVEPLLLKLGWNRLLVRVVQVAGEWKFAGKFSSSDPAFLSKLEFSATPP